MKCKQYISKTSYKFVVKILDMIFY